MQEPKTYYSKLLETKEKLNAVGKGFCLMKWQTETLYLHMGDNHSCYHPRPHKILLSDIKRSPGGLHNTAFKKEQRKVMLEGGRPDECQYCWNVEDLEGDHVSDRMVHSTSDYAIKDYDAIRNLDADADWNPRHIEISFGNACQLKCGYCCPQASSAWMEEIKRKGDYDITTKQYSIDFLKSGVFYEPDMDNPYVDAFWEWWPTLKNDLEVFRITGGEPLLNSNTFKLLDMLDDDPSPHLQIHINSNLGMKSSLVEKLSAKVNKLLTEGKIKDFRLFTSIDGWGERAEYMRNGLDCALWEKNVRIFLDTVPNSKINLMITFNVLSVIQFRLLLDKISSLRKEYGTLENMHTQRIGFDTPYLKEPPHWMINILPRQYMDFMHDHLRHMTINERTVDNQHGFDKVEIEKFKRVVDYMGASNVDPEVIKQGRRDFYTFFTEHDKRRNVSLLDTFPEYTDFYNFCEQVYRNYK